MSDMKSDIQRWRNSAIVPAVYGLKGDALKALTVCLTDNAGDDCKLLWHRAMYEDGTPTLWWEVKVGDASVQTGNIVFTCPPLPPEECE